MKRYLFYASNLYALPVLRPLQTAIRKRGDEVAWFSVNEVTPHILPDEYRLNTAHEVMSYSPDAVFVAGNVVPDFFPGIKVQVFHGFNARKRPDDRGHFRIRGFFDLYCTQGPDTTLPFQQLADRLGHFEVCETGWSKMDPLFQDAEAPSSNPKKRPVILYTSTFTPNLSSAYHLADTLSDLSQTGEYDWIVTFHPKMAAVVKDRYYAMEGPHLSFVDTDDTIPLLRSADAMISDTSSIAYEFLLQHKPVITFRTRIPGPHFIDVSEPGDIEGAIAEALKRRPEQMAAIRACSDAIHPYRDGLSSDRILDCVESRVENGLHLRKSKPLNFTRKIKIRKTLGYYRW